MANFYGYTPQPFVFDAIINKSDFDVNNSDSPNLALPPICLRFPKSFIFEEKKMINDPVFNYEYTKEDLNNAQKPFIAHYDKDKLTKVDSDAISDENNKLPNALLWYGFIIEREEAHVCKNPDCKAIILDRYFHNTKCPYCGKKKFGFSVVKTGSAELKELFGPIYEIINSNKIYSVLDL